MISISVFNDAFVLAKDGVRILSALFKQDTKEELVEILTQAGLRDSLLEASLRLDAQLNYKQCPECGAFSSEEEHAVGCMYAELEAVQALLATAAECPYAHL